MAKAEEDHQMAIREKLDLEVKLKEEMQITKVSLDWFFFFLPCAQLSNRSLGGCLQSGPITLTVPNAPHLPLTYYSINAFQTCKLL